MKSSKPGKKSVFPLIMGIIWGVIISLSVWAIVKIFTYTVEPYRGEDLMVGSIHSEKYGKLYTSISYDIEDGLNSDDDPHYKELLGTAGYIENAAQYFMYLKNGDSEKAEYFKSKMNKYLEDMGCLKYLSKKIDRSFGYEEDKFKGSNLRNIK